MASRAPRIEHRRTRFDWTQERKDLLRRMWEAKRTSGEIAARLGDVSRNAVMGMVDRLGLMGRGGSREAHPTRGEAVAMLEEVLETTYDPDAPGHPETLVAIAGAMCGRDAACIAKLLRTSRRNVMSVLDRYHATHVWTDGSEIPDAWFDPATGNVSLAMDAMVAAGAIDRIRNEGGSWEYRARRAA